MTTKVPRLNVQTDPSTKLEPQTPQQTHIDENMSEFSPVLLLSPRVNEGRLFVQVISCRGLELNSACAGYYCILMVEKQNSRTATVRTIPDKTKKEGVVEWGQMFNFDFTQENAEFAISVWSRGYKDLPTTEIGVVTYQIKELPPGESIKKEFKISETATLLLKFNLSPLVKRKMSEDHFERLKLIGKGSFGTVYQVRKKETGCLYAMKVLHKKNIIERNAVRHAIAERTVLKNIHHPFLVHLKYAFQTPEHLFMVIDYLNGGELFFHLQQDDAFGEERAKFYAAEIVLALGYLHDNGILYRDLKPENILLDMEGHVCIVDFGLCKTGLGLNAKTGTFCGSLEYMAPEVLAGEPYQNDIDWWALATMVYEMIEGIPPFWDERTDVMLEQITACDLQGKFDNKFSHDCIDFITSILKLDPEERLGRGPHGTEDIKSHDWFKDIDWVKLYNKQVEPPFKPHLKDESDTRYFDAEVTSEDVNAEFRKKKTMLPALDDDLFDDFSFEEPHTKTPTTRKQRQKSSRRGTPIKVAVTPKNSIKNKIAKGNEPLFPVVISSAKKKKKTPLSSPVGTRSGSPRDGDFDTNNTTKSSQGPVPIKNRKLSYDVLKYKNGEEEKNRVRRSKSQLDTSYKRDRCMGNYEDSMSFRHIKSFDVKMDEQKEQNCVIQ